MSRDKSNTEGQLAEQEFDMITQQYRNDYGLIAVSCHPEFVPLRKKHGQRKGQIVGGFFRENGPPDRHITLPDGLSCWIEIKTWIRKDTRTQRDRIHQRHFMFDVVKFAGGLGFYLVKWRWQGSADWRLHPVAGLKCIEGGIVFERVEGIEVLQNDQGLPRWYEAILEARRVSRSVADSGNDVCWITKEELID